MESIIGVASDFPTTHYEVNNTIIKIRYILFIFLVLKNKNKNNINEKINIKNNKIYNKNNIHENASSLLILELHCL